MTNDELGALGVAVATSLGLRELVAYAVKRRQTDAENANLEASAGQAQVTATRELFDTTSQMFTEFRSEIGRHLDRIKEQDDRIADLREHKERCERELMELVGRVVELEKGVSPRNQTPKNAAD